MNHHLPPDQELRLECLRICPNVAEAKNAYYWVTGEGKGQQLTPASNNAANRYAPGQIVGSGSTSNG